MTLTGIGIRNGLTKVGVGTQVQCAGLAGPVPTDDQFYYFLIPSAYTDEFHGYNIAAHSRCRGTTTNFAVMGLSERTFDAVYPWDFNNHAHEYGYQLTEGTTVSLLAIQYHADFTEVDRGLLTGLTWTNWVDEAVLFGTLLLIHAGRSGILEEILASVKRTY